MDLKEKDITMGEMSMNNQEEPSRLKWFKIFISICMMVLLTISIFALGFYFEKTSKYLLFSGKLSTLYKLESEMI
jgi:hypothetical protein